LAEKGVIVRTWGGATPAFHQDILERQRTRRDEKARIAKAAAERIQEGFTVMIEAGTTTAQVAKYLFGKRDIQIVTNSALVIPYARANPALWLTTVGGTFRPATESFVGPIALDQLDRFHVDLAIVGTDGFSPNDGTSTHLVEGAEIVKKMASKADHTVLVADSSKFGKRGFVHVLALSSLNTIITDSQLEDSALTELESTGVEIIRA
jgi:DeoR family galactitol utilization operon repressor